MVLSTRFTSQLDTLVAATITTAIVLVSLISYSRSSSDSKRLRAKLPKSLLLWRVPEDDVDYRESEAIWRLLDPVLREHGLEQWTHSFIGFLHSPGKSLPRANGFVHIAPSRASGDGVGTACRLSRIQYSNATIRVARTREGHDVTVRPIKLGEEGCEHLNILKRIATGPVALLSNNHCLPMFDTVEFQDVTLGIFPLTADTMQNAFGSWPQNSVGDVVDMILQALEGLAFLHDHNIAHRDADRSNFLVQYHPESLRDMAIVVSRPRVYIIDFEVAVAFHEDASPENCTCVGPPVGGTVTLGDWARPLPCDVSSGEPYSPFKLDVWQFGSSFSGLWTFRTNIPAIDSILTELVNHDPKLRPSAHQALNMLSSVVNKIPPKDLLVAPSVWEDGQQR